MKFILPIATFLLTASSMAQSVGIGTSTPAAGALLHVSSTSKGALIPRLTTTQIAAINSPAEGLLLFNNSTNQFNFYNGTAWQPLEMSLPNNSAVDINGTVVSLNNLSQITTQPTVNIINKGGGGILVNTATNNTSVYGINTTNGKGVSGWNTDAGHGVHARGANGTALMAEIAPGGTGVAARFKQLDPNGKALVAEGNISLTSATMKPNAGKVLTSDATGRASWQTVPYTAPRHGVEARGIAGNGANVQNRGVWFKFHFAFDNYDPGGDYRLYNQVPSSTFVVPLAGNYEISTMISFPEEDYSDIRVRIIVERAGVKTVLAAKEETTGADIFRHVRQALTLSTTAKLNAADQLYVEVYQYNDSGSLSFPLYESQKSHYFTVALIDDL